MYHHKYLEKLDYEIETLIKKEAMIDSMEVDYTIQKELHLLFENRKHLLEYMSSKHGHMAGEHKDFVQTDKHKNSLFGG